MLQSIAQKRSWPQALVIWWHRLQAVLQGYTRPAYASAAARNDLTARRFPIPPSQQHLYARAADEEFYH